MRTILTLVVLTAIAVAQQPQALTERYLKRELRIPMRDGVKLYTAVYLPRQPSGPLPIMLRRTPYGVGPYGEGQFPPLLGPSSLFDAGQWIFALQDVRGTHQSEGAFVNVRPHRAQKTTPEDTDEASDTFDTIEWLVNNLDEDNGKVGMWGISYPGFYAAAGMIDAHPALAAVSPQAPIADWWYDDFHHHGALFLAHTVRFFAGFGRARRQLETKHWQPFELGTPDAYEYFLRLGSTADIEADVFQGDIPFWHDLMAHPNYDGFWAERNLLPHLQRIAPAVLTVGGWFDAEDLYGPLAIYRTVESTSPKSHNSLVMGPWRHGGWSRDDGDRLGNIQFDAKTSLWYREQVELPFFAHWLKGEPAPDLPEALVFETGVNRWRRFAQWPPASAAARTLWLDDRGAGFRAPEAAAVHEFVSDPGNPVPFSDLIVPQMTNEYMTDDQRFASRRPDVLDWQTEPLVEPITLAGPVTAELVVSTSQQDADWIVKLIDVWPDQAPTPEGLAPHVKLGGYQQMVRSEVIRGRFRDDPARPKPFRPDEPTLVRVPLLDLLHTFRKGHRLMVQVQSTWFPLVDRNPQKWVDNIYTAPDEDFVKAVHRVHLGPQGSRLQLSVLPQDG